MPIRNNCGEVNRGFIGLCISNIIKLNILHHVHCEVKRLSMFQYSLFHSKPPERVKTTKQKQWHTKQNVHSFHRYYMTELLYGVNVNQSHKMSAYARFQSTASLMFRFYVIRTETISLIHYTYSLYFYHVKLC